MPKADRQPYVRTIFVCINERPPGQDSCGGRNSRPLQEALKAHVREKGLAKKVRITRTLCLGQCAIGPNIAIMPDNVWYHHATPEDIEEIKALFIDPLP
ncbi:MAG: (2Fe-2S) ferredoxin domain-containing protein [Nitrospirae bacterium]|nr:(2Fe-2S) ferredoxin domain-containing protein [Nitrospirota bacterium]